TIRQTLRRWHACLMTIPHNERTAAEEDVHTMHAHALSPAQRQYLQHLNARLAVIERQVKRETLALITTLTRLSPATQPHDAEAILITIGPNGPALHPASQCSSGDVPRAVPVRVGTPEESQPGRLPTPPR